MSFLPRARGAMSGQNVFLIFMIAGGVAAGIQWAEVRDAAKILQCTADPTMKNYLAQNVHRLRQESGLSGDTGRASSGASSLSAPPGWAAAELG